MPMIDKFHEDPKIFIFLISTMAGGTNHLFLIARFSQISYRYWAEFDRSEQSRHFWYVFYPQSSLVFLITTGSCGLQIPTGVRGHFKLKSPSPNTFVDPAYDLQAMDRAYRFGQTRDVDVFRLLGAGSLEETIYARQLYKQQQMEIGYNASIQTR